MSTKTCKICRDARRPRIDATLLLKPLRAVCAEFGLKRTTLHKHAQRHVRGMLERSVNKAVATYTHDLRHFLKQIQNELLMILTSARTSGDLSTALAAAAEARAVAESMRKLLTRTAEPKGNQRRNPGGPEIVVEYEGAHVA